MATVAEELRGREDSMANIKKQVDFVSTISIASQQDEVLHPSDTITCTSEEALARARLDPNSICPLFVEFASNDPADPRAWSSWKKWYIMALISLLNFVTVFIANGYSLATNEIVTEFHASKQLGNLGFSLHLWGFAAGTVILAPLSEYYGRLPVYILSWTLLVILEIPAALASNMSTILVCKALQGIVGAAPITNNGGVVSDLFVREESGPAMALYTLGTIFGPALSMVPAGLIVEYLGWRWLYWIFAISSAALWIATVLTLPETRHSTILERKAALVRKSLTLEGMGSAPIIEHIFDAHSKGVKCGVRELFSTYLTRPFRFLVTEQITIAAAAYNGLVHGIFFLFNEAFPIVFAGGHGFSTGEQGLSFLGLALGTLIAACFHPFQERYYLKRKRDNNGETVPEARMHQARLGAFLMPAALFWFAWTSFPTSPWVEPIVASAFYAAGLYIVILGVTSYMVDTYQSYSASALAAMNLVRNVFGGCFPLFADQIYENLGNEWAGSLLAFLTILFIPIPIWWFYRGQHLRAQSPWARAQIELAVSTTHGAAVLTEVISAC